MNKLTLLLACMLTLFSVHADNYFTMGQNDSIRIHPSTIGIQREVPVYAHFDGRLDAWNLTLTYSPGLSYNSCTPGDGMTIPYVDRNGCDAEFRANLSANNSGTLISSIIYEFGYWDYDGDSVYETYGTIKWEAGDYDMFSLFLVPMAAMGDSATITINGILTSTDDWRGGTIGHVIFHKQITMWVGYRRGDVNGDEVITITDSNLLASYLLNDSGLTNQYQLAAADLNGDGLINTTDLSLLNGMILNGVNETGDELLSE